MQTPIIWGESETSYIRRFLDGVDKVVTDAMQSGRSLLEESKKGGVKSLFLTYLTPIPSFVNCKDLTPIFPRRILPSKGEKA